MAALLSAFCFAANMACSRRGVLRIRDAGLGGYISVSVAPPLILTMALIGGELHSITTFTWKGYVYLATAGIVNFVFGRSSGYRAIKHLGANMTAILSSLSLVYSVLLGILILGERVTQDLVAGTALIMIGPALLFWPQSDDDRGHENEHSRKPRLTRQGVIAVLLTGIFYGITPLLIKLGLQQGGSPLAGTLISHTSAMLIFGITMIGPEKRDAIINMDRTALSWFVASGILATVAQLLSYIALKWSPITVAGPLIATIPLFIILLSFIANRRLESFRLNVILGAILVVIGVVLVYR